MLASSHTRLLIIVKQRGLTVICTSELDIDSLFAPCWPKGLYRKMNAMHYDSNEIGQVPGKLFCEPQSHMCDLVCSMLVQVATGSCTFSFPSKFAVPRVPYVSPRTFPTFSMTIPFLHCMYVQSIPVHTLLFSPASLSCVKYLLLAIWAL